MNKILVVEDELHILKLLFEVLRTNGYEVVTATDGLSAIKKFDEDRFDLVITDAMMPNIDGYRLIELVKERNTSIPIIMITALNEEYDELKGFDLGVDDFISKPFSINVVLRRVEKILQRSSQINSNISSGILNIKVNTRDVYYDSIAIELTSKEFDILAYLATNKNKTISREKIYTFVWKTDTPGDIRKIDTHVKNIRKKLPGVNIKTIVGLGYNFVE